MSDRSNIKMDTDLFEQVKAYKKAHENWNHFAENTLLPALEAYEGDGAESEGVDYAEIETRVERAVESALPKR